MSMGWTGKGGKFDVLPLIVQAEGHPPLLREIPSDLILEVCLIFYFFIFYLIYHCLVNHLFSFYYLFYFILN